MRDHRRLKSSVSSEHCVRRLDLIDERLDLPAQVLPAQHGDLLQVFLAVRRLLPLSQSCQFVDDLLPLLFCQALRVVLQLLPQLLTHLLRQSHLGRHHYDRLVGVFQEVLSDQRFKISLVHLLSQGSEGLSELEVDKGSRVVVQPCIQGAQSVDQSLGIEAVIGLSVLELKAVDAGKKRALVQSLVGDLSQRLLDGCDKLFFLLGIRVFGRHRVAGLADTEFQKGVNFFSDSLVSERFFDRGAFRVAEHVVDDLEGQVQLRIQSVGRQGDVPGQVAAPLHFLLRLH